MRKFYLVIVGLLASLMLFPAYSFAANYTVKPGDTLYRIAVNHNITVEQLTSLNELNSTMIYPGDILELPGGGQATDSLQKHTVEPGDTLYLISKAYGTTVDTIMSLNNLSDTMIYPGEVLVIQGDGQASTGGTNQKPTEKYTVQPGDTLYLISKAYGTTVDTIMSLNNLSDTMIYPGEVLVIQGDGQASTGDANPESTHDYTVQPGDTLYFISRAYGTTVDAIMSLNNLTSSDIYAGQLLKMSGKSSTTPSRGNRGSYSAEDRYLLAQIISSEAAGESFEGQIAVGAVVLNRISDYRFPNNLRDVIYEPWQFEPVQNGSIYLPPTASALRAADAAIDGWDPVSGAVYFCNPDTAQSTAFFTTLTYICRIGRHVFYR